MLIRSLLFIVTTIWFTHTALAQQIYKWQDEKGRWHFSNFPPPGVKAEKVGTGDPGRKPALQPPVTSTGEEKKAEDGSDRPAQRTSDGDPLGSASRRLLVFPPSDTGKLLSEWTPVESFDSAEECERAKALQIADSTRVTPSMSVPGGYEGGRTEVGFRTVDGRCISLAEFKPSKEANVIVTLTTVGQDQGGFSTPVLSGRVFNRGQTIARNVVVKYQVRDGRGTIYTKGEIPTTPKDIPPTKFAEFRGQIVGSTDLGDRSVHTEANWSKE